MNKSVFKYIKLLNLRIYRFLNLIFNKSKYTNYNIRNIYLIRILKLIIKEIKI